MTPIDPAALETIRARHVLEDPPSRRDGKAMCVDLSCWQDWPCDASILIAEIDRLAPLAALGEAWAEVGALMKPIPYGNWDIGWNAAVAALLALRDRLRERP
jgi:hypothetical protein